MKFPTFFTHLSYHILALIDEGESITSAEFHQHVRNKDLFVWLKDKYGDRLDLSLYAGNKLQLLEQLFSKMDIDEARKFGTENNGLCMIIGHCLNFIQYGEKTVNEIQEGLFLN